jgi:hypothetical protein
MESRFKHTRRSFTTVLYALILLLLLHSQPLHLKPDTAQPAFHPHSKVSTDLHKPCTEPQPKRNHTEPNQNPNLSKKEHELQLVMVARNRMKAPKLA